MEGGAHMNVGDENSASKKNNNNNDLMDGSGKADTMLDAMHIYN